MPMIRAAFFVQESEKTWNSCRIPRLVDVENSHPRTPYIEDEIWESLPRTCERPCPRPAFLLMLGQTHMNGWSRVIASQNGGSTSYIFPFRLRVLQWSRHLFNYWKNKKTII